MTINFIDLCSGVGGFRLALESIQPKPICLKSVDFDKKAGKTYFANFKEDCYGDITDPVLQSSLPKNPDILVGGLPCQAWSIAGNRQGFDDPRGALFLSFFDIIKQTNPKSFIIENVKGLLNHNIGDS